MGTICVCRGEESLATRVSYAKWGEDDKFVFIYSKKKKKVGQLGQPSPNLNGLQAYLGRANRPDFYSSHNFSSPALKKYGPTHPSPSGLAHIPSSRDSGLNESNYLSVTRARLVEYLNSTRS